MVTWPVHISSHSGGDTRLLSHLDLVFLYWKYSHFPRHREHPPYSRGLGREFFAPTVRSYSSNSSTFIDKTYNFSLQVKKFKNIIVCLDLFRITFFNFRKKIAHFSLLWCLPTPLLALVPRWFFKILKKFERRHIWNISSLQNVSEICTFFFYFCRNNVFCSTLVFFKNPILTFHFLCNWHSSIGGGNPF